MEYRVYDTEKRKWIHHHIFVSPEGISFIVKRSIFGWTKKFAPISYVCQKAIDLFDKNGEMVYEGDFIKARVDKDEIVIGVVTYAYEFSSYIILCFDIDKYYTLGTQVCNEIEVIGNVFDGYESDVQEDEERNE